MSATKPEFAVAAAIHSSHPKYIAIRHLLYKLDANACPDEEMWQRCCSRNAAPARQPERRKQILLPADSVKSQKVRLAHTHQKLLELQTDLKAERDDHRIEMDQLKQELEAAVTAKANQMSLELHKERDNHQVELVGLKEGLEHAAASKIDHMKAEFQAERDSHQAEMSRLQDELVAAVAARTDLLNSAFQAERSGHQAEMDRLKEEQAAAVAARTQQVDGLQRELDATIVSGRSSLAEEKSQTQMWREKYNHAHLHIQQNLLPVIERLTNERDQLRRDNEEGKRVTNQMQHEGENLHNQNIQLREQVQSLNVQLQTATQSDSNTTQQHAELTKHIIAQNTEIARLRDANTQLLHNQNLAQTVHDDHQKLEAELQQARHEIAVLKKPMSKAAISSDEKADLERKLKDAQVKAHQNLALYLDNKDKFERQDVWLKQARENANFYKQKSQVVMSRKQHDDEVQKLRDTIDQKDREIEAIRAARPRELGPNNDKKRGKGGEEDGQQAKRSRDDN